MTIAFSAYQGKGIGIDNVALVVVDYCVSSFYVKPIPKTGTQGFTDTHTENEERIFKGAG